MLSHKNNLAFWKQREKCTLLPYRPNQYFYALSKEVKAETTSQDQKEKVASLLLTWQKQVCGSDETYPYKDLFWVKHVFDN